MNKPESYRKKPVEVLAWQWDGTDDFAKRIVQWINGNKGEASYVGPKSGDPNCPDKVSHTVFNYCPSCDYISAEPGTGTRIRIMTLEGPIYASPMDYVIQGVAGEFYPCKPDIFEATYEEVE